MNSPVLIVEQKGSVRWLRLNRPGQRNALNDELIHALRSQLEDIEQDPGTAVVVLVGEGASFCAGGDFRHFLREGGRRGPLGFLTALSECFTAIEGSSKPWIAALHGHAIAGGLELALVCDVVLAAHGTLIGDGHLNNMLIPAGGSSVRLERAIGRGAARWLHLSGEPVTAERLAASGWIHAVVERGNLELEAAKVAAKLAARSGPTQRRLKRLLTDVAGLGTAEGLERELHEFGENWEESEAPATLRKFLASRSDVRASQTKESLA